MSMTMNPEVQEAGPYRLAAAASRGGERTVVEVGGRRIGDGAFGLIAGPCTVESREQTLAVADAVAAGGASMLRGGAYKPRTSPYSFQGLGRAGLALLAETLERVAVSYTHLTLPTNREV